MITVAVATVGDAPARGSVHKTITIQTAASLQPNVRSLREVSARLKGRGKKVGRKEKVEQPFLSVKGQIISVDDQDIQVFEYRGIRAAELEAKKITDTRSTSLARWIAPTRAGGGEVLISLGKWCPRRDSNARPLA